MPGLAPFMGWISWFFPPRENGGWGLRKSEMLMLNMISEVVWVDKYNVRPACQLMAQWDHPGVWQLWQVTVTRLYILTTSPPHYSLKCKSSLQPNMADEHGLNRWLHLHISSSPTFQLYFDLEYIDSHQPQPTPLLGMMRVYNPSSDWGYYMWQTVVFSWFISYKIHTWLLQSLVS